MTRKNILAEAERCVCGHREEDYGSPEDNFYKVCAAMKDRCSNPASTAYKRFCLVGAQGKSLFVKMTKKQSDE